MQLVIFTLIVVGAVLVGLGLNPFIETVMNARSGQTPHEPGLAPERTGRVTFPLGIASLALAFLISLLWAGANGVAFYGSLLQFASFFFLGRWLWLRFAVGFGDHLNHKILADRLGRTDDRDHYALDYHHQKRFVAGFFPLIGFGCLLFVLSVFLQSLA